MGLFGRYNDAKNDLLHAIWDRLSVINGKTFDPKIRTTKGGFATVTEDLLNEILNELINFQPIRYKDGKLQYLDGSNWIDYQTLPASTLTFLDIQTLSAGGQQVSVSVSSNNLVTPIVLTSSDTSVVTVTKVGGTWKVQGVGPGTATITATQLPGNGFSAANGVVKTVTVIGPTITSLVADVGTTPITQQFVVQAQNNAFTLFTGAQSGTLPGYKDVAFPIYYSINNGTVRKVQAYWMTKNIFRANPGDVIRISSDVARSFRVSQFYHDGSLSVASVNTTTPTDKAAPGYFTPSAGHLILPKYNSGFYIKANGNRQPVLIKEINESNSSQQSGTYAYIVEPSRDLFIQTVSRTIAIGTTDGISLNIVVPVGTVVNGTSKDERIADFVVTGTSRQVNSVSTLMTAIASAVAGDEIVLAAGNYVTTQAITNASFVANVALGYKGQEGIQLRGATGNSSDVVLKLMASGYSVDNSTATRPSWIRDLVFDNTGGGNPQLSSGSWVLKNCWFDGVDPTDTSGNGNHISLLVNNSGHVANFLVLDCKGTNASADIFNVSGVATNTANSQASIAIFLNCIGSNCGNFANSQCLTTHELVPVHWVGGLLEKSNTDVVASQLGNASYTYLTYAKLSANGRKCGTNNSAFWGCEVVGAVLALGVDGSLWCYQTYVGFAPTASFTSLFRNNAATVAHNIFEVLSGSSTRCFFYSLDTSKTTSVGNVIKGYGEGVMHQLYSTSPAATATQRVYGNTYVNCTTAISGGDVNATLRLANNATKGSTNSIAGVPTGANAAKYISEGCNVLDPAVDSDFIKNFSDLLTQDAALDSSYFPIANGNCDATGINTVMGYVGDRDMYGLVWIPGTALNPVGARAQLAGVNANANAQFYVDAI